MTFIYSSFHRLPWCIVLCGCCSSIYLIMLLLLQLLCKSIASELPVIQQVESNANQVLESMPYGPERDILKCKLVDISRRVSAVNEKSTERKQALDSVQPLIEQYRDALNAFLPYLDGAEDKLESLKKVSCDEESVVSQNAEAQVKLGHI